MNTKIYHNLYMLFVAGALLASGCSNDDDTYDFYAAHPDAVRFNITAGDVPQPRVNTEGDGTTFDVKDQIAISADGGTSYSTYVQSSGDDWLPAEGQRYLRWKEEELSFQAYYPVTEGTDYTHFTVPTDQELLDDLRKADYMTAAATGQSSEGPVKLTFKHQLAKVTVFVTLSEELKGKEIQSISFYIWGHILENGNITDGTNYIEYKPYHTGETYTAILPPQAASPLYNFIAVSLKGVNTPYILKGIPELKPGKAYTLALQVGHDGVKLVRDITVEEWENEVDMKEGTANLATIWDGNYPISVPAAKAWMGEETSGANDPTAANHVFTIKAARQLAALHYLMVNDVKLNGAVGTPDGYGDTIDDGYGDATYNLAADIDLNDKPWIAIGSKQRGGMMFKGTFNGQGHTVSGMNAVQGTEMLFSAFISVLAGTVKYLNVKGTVNVKENRNMGCGGIVSYFTGGTIAFCSFQGSITLDNNATASYIGGIAGYFQDFSPTPQVISCYSVLSGVEGGTDITRKGGIVGYVQNTGVIKGCYWQTLTGLSDTDPYGGKQKGANPTVENCGTFTDAARANDNTVITAMNQYDADYDYHWQAGSDGGYPVLVKKQP